MKKLIRGIIDFRRKLQPDYREMFSKLALGQAPDALLITCSDSRVAPNLFASTDPGDTFVMRNVGNLVPLCGEHGVSTGDEAEGAALEFAMLNLNVRDIIICGHSECGAMRAILEGALPEAAPNLKRWIRHGKPALDKLESGIRIAPERSKHNELSQLNVLEQMDNVRSYPVVRERLERGEVRIHGWWFDIARAEVSTWDSAQRRFVPIDEIEAAKVIEQLER